MDNNETPYWQKFSFFNGNPNIRRITYQGGELFTMLNQRMIEYKMDLFNEGKSIKEVIKAMENDF